MDKAEFRENYRKERCLFFAKHRKRTVWRLRFLYASAVFFGITAVMRTAAAPFELWDLFGFAFVAMALMTANWIRKMLREGDELLRQGVTSTPLSDRTRRKNVDTKDEVIDVTARETSARKPNTRI
jgi:hypothetical protein